MSSVTAVDPAPAPMAEPPVPYSRWRLLAGVIGRAWIWFVIGCLLVTFVPMLFGWRPYVIESGSMSPRIKVGDVILASPEHNAQKLFGHVTVFNDPDRPGHIKSHRVIKINTDGTLVTKGDANLSPDSDPVQMSAVRGVGRLLVRWVGLPLTWVKTGQWLNLLLLLGSFLLAGFAVASDDEDDREEDDDPEDTPPDDPDGALLPFDRDGRTSSSTPTQIAATKPFTLPGALERGRHRALGGLHRKPFLLLNRSPVVTRIAVRVGVVALASSMLLVPTTFAAFGATTKNTADTWTVPNWDYPTVVNSFGPYLYWKLDETGTATTAADSSGNARTGQYNGNLVPNGTATYFTRLGTGALITDTPNSAVQLNNANSCINTTSNTLVNAPAAVTVMIWFKATAGYALGGKLAGFEKPRVGVAAPPTGTYDRHLYMDGAGHVWFGVYNNGYVSLESSAALNDGNWHMAVGTVGATGTRLYIDGVLNAANVGNTAGEATTGVWRAGCGNLAGWGVAWTGANSPGIDSTVTANRAFQGGLDQFVVYTSELSATNIAFIYWTR